MFLDFSLQGFFMGTITTLYTVTLSCFFRKVSEVFAQAFIIYIFIFVPLNFLKIIFILREVQTLNRVLQYICVIN
jgi:hypothetical protein